AGPPPHRRGAAPQGSVTSRSAQRPSCPPHPRATGSRAPRAPATTPTTRGRPRPPRGAPPRPRRAPFAPPRELPAAPGAAPSNPPAISATNAPMSDPRSEQLHRRAEAVLPGGVNSPVRAFRAVGGHPGFIESARGARVVGADGREYIDFVGSWGPAILGHAEPTVVAAVQQAATRGLSFGAPTEGEVLLAEKLIELFPSIEMVRCVSSGTEATMSALRAARG